MEIKGLRDRFDAERLRANLRPVTNKEISEATDIPESTLSELLASKRDMVPDWDTRVSLIVDYLGGEPQEWVAKWRKARAAYENLDKSEESQQNLSTESGQTRKTPNSGSASWQRTNFLKSGHLFLALGTDILVAGVSAAVIATQSSGTPGFDSGTQPANNAGAQCVRVRDETETVSVFKDPRTRDTWTEWPGKTRFRADVDESNPRRYRVLLRNGQYGYVNTDKRYVVSAKDCS
ncbi:hypothetical protein EV192_102800 [Actinocrispum wychmicini]|uniref:Uncharacterized protein n=2 Tax=Actinocrispum wychmicini TaxID=1213861 RepID=A0A4R2JQY6_9PSEU|nr:hypothetical protein EV192_102800 [Actinocrispum wychmicini]